MHTTVGKFEIRATAIGTSTKKWSGRWSIYVAGMREHDAILEGATDAMRTASDAEHEALRLGIERAKAMDDEVGHVTVYSDRN